MRTVTTEVKCDPKQLERIRQKQKTPHTTKEFEDRMPASGVINECQVSEVSAVELDDGYRSTRSSAAMAPFIVPSGTAKSFSETEIGIKMNRQPSQRSHLPRSSNRASQENIMRMKVDDQAAAKRRRMMPLNSSQIPKTLPKTGASRSFVCKNLKPEPIKGGGSSQKKAAEDGAILRLLHAESNKEGKSNSANV